MCDSVYFEGAHQADCPKGFFYKFTFDANVNFFYFKNKTMLDKIFISLIPAASQQTLNQTN
jgi:hypothetical protein